MSLIDRLFHSWDSGKLVSDLKERVSELEEQLKESDELLEKADMRAAKMSLDIWELKSRLNQAYEQIRKMSER